MSDPQELPPPVTQQHTSSRLLQSLIHTYAEVQNYQSQVVEQQATIHDINYQSQASYRSNTSEKQSSRLMELMEKKQSQLKNLQSFLIKEFEQITQNKEKHAKIKSDLQNLLESVHKVKDDMRMQMGMKEQLHQMKSSITQQFTKILQFMLTKQQAATNGYKKQITDLHSIIDQQQQTIHQLQQKSQLQSQQIKHLNEQLAQNQMTNSEQPFKLEGEHLSKPIQKRQSMKQLSQEELEVSFSADKNSKAKQLLNAIFHLKSNESLHGIKEGQQIRNTHKTVQDQHHRPLLSQQHRSSTGGFNHIMLKDSNSSSQSPPQQAKSPQQQSSGIQSSSVHRINSSNNNLINDTSSAINKLDIFSELNPANNSQDDQLSYYNQQDEYEKYSEMEFRNMKKDKVSRSLKATRNPTYAGYGGAFGGYGYEQEEGKDIQEEVLNKRNDTQPLSKIKPDTPQQKTHPKTTQPPTKQSPNIKSPLPQSKHQPQQQQFQSPNTKRKTAHRYDYCKLYEQQEIKQIQNLNIMCNHLIINDKVNVVASSASRMSTFSSFERVGNSVSKELTLTPSRKSRQISPNKSSYSKFEPIRFQYSQQRQSGFKNINRSINNYPTSSFSNTKKPLTIQIPSSPNQLQQSNQKTIANPYLKLQNHIHQLSFQQFSPQKSRQNQKTHIAGYLEKSQTRSRTSYSDLRNQMRQDLRRQLRDHQQSQNIQQQQRTRPKQRQYQVSTFEQPTTNIDRKQYIKSKIQMMKKKNMTQTYHQATTKSPNKISFLKSQQPQNHLSRTQLQRPVINRSVSRNNIRSYHEMDDHSVKGYDFSEDKFEKEVMDKSRKTDRNLHNTSMSRADLQQKSKDASRVSYNNHNNVSYSKIDRMPQLTKENLKKSSSYSQIDNEQQHNDIYSQLNHGYTQHSDISAEHKIPTLQQSISKKSLSRPTQPIRQSVSPLRPTSKNTNNMYLMQQPAQRSSTKEQSKSRIDYQQQKQRYNEDNLYKHPYLMERKRTSTRNDENITFDNPTMFRRF